MLCIRITMLACLYFLFLPPVLAHNTEKPVKGRVVDKQNGAPLAFVHILIKGSQEGTMTDIDGFFNLVVADSLSTLELSYVGYQKQTYELSPAKEIHFIKMQPQAIELNEVVVFPGENPAHRIIRNAIQNRSFNDPERLNTFQYEGYNKFVATFDRDFYLERWETENDSAALRLMNFADQRHFFIMESVTERIFRYPSRNNETVIANRVSGMENPLFTMVATELQSFSFYKNHITVLENEYVSPLNAMAFKGYFYHLKDTLYEHADTVFVIEYRPENNARFDGLEGVLYINTHRWGIQNVIAQPWIKNEAGISFRIQQQYARPNGENWFPVQLNTDIEFQFPVQSSNTPVSPIRMLGRSYLSNIEINHPIEKKQFTPYDVDFDPHANLLPPNYWNNYRAQPLNVKEENTYLFLDSLGRAQNFDRIMHTAEPFLYGEIPLGRFSLDMRRFYNFNNYEGHRLGLGLFTNRRMSRFWKVGGYFGYGTKDQRWKYGYSGELLLHQRTDLRLGGRFSLDVSQRGGTSFNEKQFLLSPSFIRNLYTNTMDITRKQEGYLSFRSIQHYLHTEISFASGKTWWDDMYYFMPGNQNLEGYRDFRFAQASLKLRFAWGETFMNTPLRVIQLPSGFPVFHLNIIKGFDQVQRGEFDYLKVESKLDIHYPLPLLGEQTWILEGGWINRSDLPWPLLYTAKAGGRLSWVAAPLSFGTMNIDEFVSHQYVSLSFMHNFQSLLLRTPSYEPELVLITNLGWGKLSNENKHIYPQMKGWEKGFFESGIAINKIFPQKWVRRIVLGMSPGIEFMYRYGPYAFDDPMQNLTIKMTVVTAL